jgi:recombination protein RecR
MEYYTQALQALIVQCEGLPGIGKKTAERLAYHVLRSPAEEILKLAEAIRAVKETVRNCRICSNITEKELCAICEDPARDAATVCVVEQPKDLYAIEKTGAYKGRYHVLLGAFAPLEGVNPEDLTLEALFQRIRTEGIKEVILATNPNYEGDGTALYIAERLKGIEGLSVTRLARGLPSGSLLEHVSKTIVSDALEGRRALEK